MLIFRQEMLGTDIIYQQMLTLQHNTIIVTHSKAVRLSASYIYASQKYDGISLAHY